MKDTNNVLVIIRLCIYTVNKVLITFTKGRILMRSIRNKCTCLQSPFSALCSSAVRYWRRERCFRLWRVFDNGITLVWNVLWHQPQTPYLTPTPSFLFRSNRQSACSYYLHPCDGQLINHSCAVLFFNFFHLPPLCPHVFLATEAMLPCQVVCRSNIFGSEWYLDNYLMDCNEVQSLMVLGGKSYSFWWPSYFSSQGYFSNPSWQDTSYCT